MNTDIMIISIFLARIPLRYNLCRYIFPPTKLVFIIDDDCGITFLKHGENINL